MNYEESIEWIHARGKFGIKPGIKRMEYMLGRLNHPEGHIRGIHVGGTNGKGSTVAYMRNALVSNGYTVGTFTSPYIEKFNERISLNGEPIGDDEIASLATTVRPIVEELARDTSLGEATEFEVITLMMFVYFGKVNPVDFVVVEAGLGVMYDSTNVFKPVMTVLTSIGLDHVDILGDTLLDITKDKASIIKPGVPMAFNINDSTSKDYVHHVLHDQESKGIELARDIVLIQNGDEFDFQYLHYDFHDIRLKMIGRHQQENAALAIASLLDMIERGLVELDLNIMIQAIEETSWPGRIEIVQENPLIMIDGAHNLEAMDVLKETMLTKYADRDITVMFSAIKGKPVAKMLGVLESFASKLVVTEFDFFKKMPVAQLYQLTGHPDKEQVDDYLKYIDEFDGDLLLVTGSLYFISTVKQHFNQK